MQPVGGPSIPAGSGQLNSPAPGVPMSMQPELPPLPELEPLLEVDRDALEPLDELLFVVDGEVEAAQLDPPDPERVVLV